VAHQGDVAQQGILKTVLTSDVNVRPPTTIVVSLGTVTESERMLFTWLGGPRPSRGSPVKLESSISYWRFR